MAELERLATTSATLARSATPPPAVLPVDVHIPGCPPLPVAILKGLIALLERTSEADDAA